MANIVSDGLTALIDHNYLAYPLALGIGKVFWQSLTHNIQLYQRTFSAQLICGTQRVTIASRTIRPYQHS